ncbi:MAG: hypothetical protein AAFV53_04245 [Myxococcota bacterium]
MSPIDHLHSDRSIICLCCGQVQGFNVELWKEGVAAAQAVGDLAGPEPEGRTKHPRLSIAAVNPLQGIGRDRPSREFHRNDAQTVDGVVTRNSLFVDAFPGHPLCTRCKQPVQVTAINGAAETRCSCGEVARYTAPRSVIPGLQGVIDEVHREGRPDVVTSGGHAEGLSCSSCGGPLSITEGSQLTKCGFCGLVSRIPDRVRASRLANPSPEVWWMVFSGPSQERQVLLQGGEGVSPQAIEDPQVDKTPPPSVRMRRIAGVFGIPLALLVVVGVVASAIEFILR